MVAFWVVVNGQKRRARAAEADKINKKEETLAMQAKIRLIERDKKKSI